jgi:hypothetical protein
MAPIYFASWFFVGTLPVLGVRSVVAPGTLCSVAVPVLPFCSVPAACLLSAARVHPALIAALCVGLMPGLFMLLDLWGEGGPLLVRRAGWWLLTPFPAVSLTRARAPCALCAHRSCCTEKGSSTYYIIRILYDVLLLLLLLLLPSRAQRCHSAVWQAPRVRSPRQGRLW